MFSKLTTIAIATGFVLCAVSAHASHQWYAVNYSSGKCIVSPGSPQDLYNVFSSDKAHSDGYSINRIAPSDVIKDDKGNIQVSITGTENGNHVEWHFFTSMEACSNFIRDNNVTPGQADKSDIN